VNPFRQVFLGFGALFTGMVLLSPAPGDQPVADDELLADLFIGRFRMTFTGAGKGATSWQFTENHKAIENGKEQGTWKVERRKIVITYYNKQAGRAVLEFKDDDTLVGNNVHRNGAVFNWVVKRERPRKATGPEGEKDPFVKGVVNDLGFLFRYVDDLKQGFLTEDELARAFRGKSAKPYKDEMTERILSTGKEKPDGAGLARLKPEPKELKRYPDYVFLLYLDKDNDGKISRTEYDAWVTDVVTAAKAVKVKADRIQHLQEEIALKTLPDRLRAQYRIEILRTEAALAALQDQYRQLEHLRRLEQTAATGGRYWHVESHWYWWRCWKRCCRK
jgi:hypothetical protein